jgi:hypothetical protein
MSFDPGVINYQYSTNFGHFDDSNRGVQILQDITETVNESYNKMLNSGAYESQHGHALLAAQQNFNQKMGEHIATATALTQRGVQKQYDTAAHDAQLAGSI